MRIVSQTDPLRLVVGVVYPLVYPSYWYVVEELLTPFGLNSPIGAGTGPLWPALFAITTHIWLLAITTHIWLPAVLAVTFAAGLLLARRSNRFWFATSVSYLVFSFWGYLPAQASTYLGNELHETNLGLALCVIALVCLGVRFRNSRPPSPPLQRKASSRTDRPRLDGPAPPNPSLQRTRFARR